MSSIGSLYHTYFFSAGAYKARAHRFPMSASQSTKEGSEMETLKIDKSNDQGRILAWARNEHSSLVLVHLPLIDIPRPPGPKGYSPTHVKEEPVSCAEHLPQSENPRTVDHAKSTSIKVEPLSCQEEYVPHSYMSTPVGHSQGSFVKKELSCYEEQNLDIFTSTHTQYSLTSVKEEPLSAKDHLPHPDIATPTCRTKY